MSTVPDPVLLDAAAVRLQQHAATIRSRGATLAAHAADCHWDGPAARAFRREAAEAVGRLRTAGHRLDDAADALCRHAVAASIALREQEYEMRIAKRLLGGGR